ncbi:MAG: hypothetical protein HC840_01120 [Leptolyngbyaceae cyanobacterium RM2_2_4]|nr:hypothetical protein [Leptolyngbyaceae cyanobacterium RM2_2_4]
MFNIETIEQELRQYIEDSANLSRQDRYTYLKAIFDKHYAMEKTEHLLTMNDFQQIISYAKSQFVNLTLPATISKRDVYPSEVPHIMMIEAVISYLNRSKVLKKLVRIDYTTKTNK